MSKDLIMKKLFAFILFSGLAYAYAATLTGQCGMLWNGNFAGFDLAQSNQSGQIANMLLLINFDTNTVFISNATISNYGMASPPSFDWPGLLKMTAAQVNSSTTFTLTSDYIPGSYKLTFTGTNAFMTLLPVNSGNTFLVQLPGNGTGMAPKTGICQKV